MSLIGTIGMSRREYCEESRFVSCIEIRNKDLSKTKMSEKIQKTADSVLLSVLIIGSNCPRPLAPP
jgi:hypothetical protein